MNGKKNKKIIEILIGLIFGIVFLETLLYYQNSISNPFYLICLGIMNGVRIFGIKSQLDIFDVLQADHDGFFRNLLGNLYILCYFGAPLITAKYLLELVNYLIKDRFFWGKPKESERILIVGYNEHVEKLAKNIIDENKKNKNKNKLVILHKGEIPEKKRFEFQMSGVMFREYRKLDYKKEEDRKELLKWLHPELVKRIIFLEEKDMDNFSNYCFFLNGFKEDGYSGFKNDLEIDCNYNLSQVEQLIWMCFDKNPVGLKYSMNTFSIPMLQAQAVLDEHSVYGNIVDAQGGDKDVHLLIIGFGRMGRRFFKRAINQGVVSEKNNIIVDIVEKDIEKAQWYFERLCKDYYNSNKNRVHIGSKVVEGDLRIRLHGFDSNDIRFADCMERISEENPFTYIAICIDNPDESVNCMLQVESYLQMKEQIVPVLMRMDSGQQLKELESIYNKLHLVPGDDEILSMNHIRSEHLKMVSENIHKKDDTTQSDRSKYAYQIEARKYRVLHYDAKKKVADSLKDSDRKHILELFHSSEYTDPEKQEEFIDRIKEDELLWKLGAIEHRRWCYYMILSGWTYGEKKDEGKKVTPYLCPFAKILESNELKKSAYYEYKDWEEIITG